MLQIRRAIERGTGEHGWLHSKHTFSFASYYDPKQMGFRALRVINEDHVEAGHGFGSHPHRDMEIISYVLDGALEHADNMGNGSVIRPGDVQRMSAGTGIVHSEYNHSKTDAVHFLQIWIEPEARGLQPGYEQTHFGDDEKRGRFRLIASRDGRQGSVVVHQDVAIYAALLDGKERLEHAPKEGRGYWLHVAKGELTANGQRLMAGDAVFGDYPQILELEAGQGAEVLLFDLA
jgi:redox-sensitive bicupin YhaK (pirin superfamily)